MNSMYKLRYSPKMNYRIKVILPVLSNFPSLLRQSSGLSEGLINHSDPLKVNNYIFVTTYSVIFVDIFYNYEVNINGIQVTVYPRRMFNAPEHTTYIECTQDVQKTSTTSYLRSIYVLCPGGSLTYYLKHI